MVAIRAVVTPNVLTSARVTPQQEVLVTSYKVGVQNITLNDLIDVSTEAASDGSLLTFNASTQIWEAKATLDNQNTEFNGGFF